MIIYLVKSTLLLGLLFMLYKLLLENEKMHRFNRFFLLFALVFGLSATLISFEIQPEEVVAGIKMQQVERVVNAPAEAVSRSVESVITPGAFTETGMVAVPFVPPEESGWSPSATDILLGLYGLVTLILLVRFSGGLLMILNKIKSGNHEKAGPATLVLLDEPVTPQSFFKFIFLDRRQFESGEIEPEILEHELTHVRQVHSLDVLVMEFVKVIFWFNPLMYLYKHAIQLNHEYIADDSVIRKGSPVDDYQNMLIRVCSGGKTMITASGISYALTKKRLNMMVKQSSVLRSGSKGLFFVPLLLATTLMFCTKTVDDGFRKININGDRYYSDDNLYMNYERSVELGLENQGPIRFDSTGNLFTGVHQTRYRSNDLPAFEYTYENGVWKSSTRYNEEGDVLGSYLFGVIAGEFMVIGEYDPNGTLIEEWTKPQADGSPGSIKQWHPNGQLKFEAYYRGRLAYEGLMTMYDEEGNILQQERYEDGELIATLK